MFFNILYFNCHLDTLADDQEWFLFHLFILFFIFIFRFFLCVCVLRDKSPFYLKIHILHILNENHSHTNIFTNNHTMNYIEWYIGKSYIKYIYTLFTNINNRYHSNWYISYNRITYRNTYSSTHIWFKILIWSLIAGTVLLYIYHIPETIDLQILSCWKQGCIQITHSQVFSLPVMHRFV